MIPPPPADPFDLVASLAPYRETLTALQKCSRPFGVEWDACTEAIQALDRVGEKFGGRPQFFTARQMVPVIGEVCNGGEVRFYPGSEKILAGRAARA